MMNHQIGFIVLALFLIMTLAFLILVIASVRCIDRIEDLLSRSKFISDSRVLYSRAGLPGKVLRLCLVSTLLMMPRVFAIRGLADLEQVRNFPGGLRVFLVSMWGVVLLCLFFVAYLDFDGG